MLGRAARDVVVVDLDDGGRIARSDDADDGPADRQQPVDLVVIGLETDRDETVEPLAGEEVLEDPVAAVGARLRVVEREVETALQQGLLDALEHFGEEPAVHVRHDDADVLRAPGRQAHRARGGHVADRRGGIHHASARVLRHVAGAAERAAGRRLRDSRQAGDLRDPAHTDSPPRGRLLCPRPGADSCQHTRFRTILGTVPVIDFADVRPGIATIRTRLQIRGCAISQDPIRCVEAVPEVTATRTRVDSKRRSTHGHVTAQTYPGAGRGARRRRHGARRLHRRRGRWRRRRRGRRRDRLDPGRVHRRAGRGLPGRPRRVGRDERHHRPLRRQHRLPDRGHRTSDRRQPARHRDLPAAGRSEEPDAAALPARRPRHRRRRDHRRRGERPRRHRCGRRPDLRSAVLDQRQVARLVQPGRVRGRRPHGSDHGCRAHRSAAADHRRGPRLPVVRRTRIGRCDRMAGDRLARGVRAALRRPGGVQRLDRGRRAVRQPARERGRRQGRRRSCWNRARSTAAARLRRPPRSRRRATSSSSRARTTVSAS